MTAVVGRISEKNELDRAMQSSGAELIVVYGRRRVGKTFLIREHLRNAIIFELTGLHNEPLQRQLESFALQLRTRTGRSAEIPHSWLQAFAELKQYVTDRKPRQEKKVSSLMSFPGLRLVVRGSWQRLRNSGTPVRAVIRRSHVSSAARQPHG